MKICFIAPKAYQLFNPKINSTFGGAEIQLYLLATKLAKKKDLDTHFMVADYGQEEKETIKNVNVWKSLNFKDNILKQSFDFFKVFNKINADVYIQRTLTTQSGLIALYCKLNGKKFVYMVAHDTETDRTHKIYKSMMKSFFAKLAFKYADNIIVQNEYQKNNLLSNFKAKSNILNSSYPINNRKNKKKYVLWVGRSEEWKRPRLFLKLARNNPEQKFVMICPSSTDNSNLSKKIERETEKIDNLEFHNFIPFNKIDKYFQKAKVFVNTSTREGFPNTFIQATKNKTPILSLNVNPNDFITKHNCGFFCKGEFNLLNKKLKELLENKKLYRKMSNNAYKYAKENHDIKVNAKEFMEIIRK